MTSARFKINNTLTATAGFDATSGETLTLILEDSPLLDVSSVTYSIIATSESAPAISGFPTTYSGATSPSTPLVMTAPVSGIHSYAIQAQVNGGVDQSGSLNPLYTVVRIVSIRGVVSGLRKEVPGETTAYNTAGGWAFAQNEMVDEVEAVAAGGASGGPAGTCTLEQFNARGDDSTDDNAAFVAAEAAILAGTYSALLVGAKHYFIGTGGIRVPANSSVKGQGPGATRIRTNANNDIFRLASILAAVASDTVTFAAAGHTITRDSGSWITDGFTTDSLVRVGATASNNGEIGKPTAVTALVLTFASGIVNETIVSSGTLSIAVHPNKIKLSGMHLMGSSAGSNQIGIELGYLGTPDGGDDVFVDNVVAENFGGAGGSFAYGTGNTGGPSVNNFHAINCAFGIRAFTQMTITNSSSKSTVSGAIGLDVQGGNVTATGCDFSVNPIGVRIIGGGNSAHGIVSSTNINHCPTYGVKVEDNATNGFTLDACHIYESPIYVGNNSGPINFLGCDVDPSSLTFTATSCVRFLDCLFPNQYGNVDNGIGDVDITNPRSLIGVALPTWVTNRMFPRYTFPGDADQSLAPNLCRAKILTVLAGTITAARTLTNSLRPPKVGERIRLSNQTAFTVNYAWSSGNGIAIPTNMTADIGADGTNATCEMIASNVAAASGVVDPTTLSLTGFYRGTWAVPWTGTASAGSSGSHSLVSNGADPVAGLTLNGHQAADFAGTHNLRDITETMDLYITTTAYRLHFLIYVTGTSAPAGAAYDNPGIWTEAGGNFGVVIDTGGIHVYHNSATVASSAGALSTGAWHDVDILFDGAHVTVTVDGTAGTPGATAGTGSLTGSAVHVGGNYNNAHMMDCQLEDLIVAPTSLIGTTAAQFKAYVNNRYGLSL